MNVARLAGVPIPIIKNAIQKSKEVQEQMKQRTERIAMLKRILK